MIRAIDCVMTHNFYFTYYLIGKCQDGYQKCKILILRMEEKNEYSSKSLKKLFCNITFYKEIVDNICHNWK